MTDDGDENGAAPAGGDDGATPDGGDDGAAPDGTDDRPDLPEVPEDPDAAVAEDDHVLPLEGLQYPTFEFEEGTVDEDGRFDLERDLDREEMREWLEELAGGLRSHDVAVEGPDGRVTLGVAPEGAEMQFDPGETHVGEFEVTLKLRAKAMVVNDSDDPKVGARGGKGFVPLAMLTADQDQPFRCYNWIQDPTDG